MKTVTCLVAGDVPVEGVTKALHVGQAYELPDDVAKSLIASGRAFAGSPPAPEKKEAAPAEENKLADSPPENKAPKRRDSRRSTIQRRAESR